jgi:hypothetical protein
LIPVICWKMKNTLTTISARRTPGVQARRPWPFSTCSTTSAARRTSSMLASVPSAAMAICTSSYRPCRSSHRGDSGIRVRSTIPTRAGTAPRPRTSRQPTVAALFGKAAKMTSATM